MATQLRLDPDAVLGKLVRLWSWAEVNKIKGNDLGVTREFLDKLAGKKGFALSMERCGWLQEVEGRLVFPNFERHNGPSSKGRALTAQRVARHRDRKRKSNDVNVSELIQNRELNEAGDVKIEPETNDVKGVELNGKNLKSNDLTDSERMEDAVVVPESGQQAEGVVNISSETEPDATHLEEQEAAVEPPETEAAKEDGSAKKRKGRGIGGSGRKVPVANPPDQPLLF